MWGLKIINENPIDEIFSNLDSYSLNLAKLNKLYANDI